jgi:hypothetical protein
LILLVWGVITRVRRRVFAGAFAVVGALVLILAVPVVQFVPDVTGALLWVTLGGIGLLLLFAATTIEHNRARVRATVRRLDQLMSGWE